MARRVSSPLVVGRDAEAALWDGRLPDARHAVAEGLEQVAAAEEPIWTTELCRTALAVEAAAAEQARARRAAAEEQTARRRAGDCSGGSGRRPPRPR